DGHPQVIRVDIYGNELPVELDGKTASCTLSQRPVWLVVKGGSIVSAEVGTPTYAEGPAPQDRRKLLEDFESRDWRYDNAVYEPFQSNHWDMPREPGSMAHERVQDQQRRSTVFRVQLTSPNESKPMVGFYGVFVPPKPIDIPGKARSLGVWMKGASGWNRIIYEIADAKGELYR
ncbi:MAG: hypothetical protein JJ992_19800, partial [Planctomycetes bacterium]|nr:hypothetical protein [Planctomycetota bacterium]